MNISSNMTGYIRQLNGKLEITTEEIASGEKSQLSTLEYKQKLQIDDNLSNYTKVNEQLVVLRTENEIADKMVDEIKTTMEAFQSKLMLANNSTTSDVDRDSIVVELKSYKNAIVDMSNTKVMDKYLFGGNEKEIQPFSFNIDSDGNYTNVEYNGSANKFKQNVGDGITKEQGLTGLNLYDGLVDQSGLIYYDEKGYKVIPNGVDENGEYQYLKDENGSYVYEDDANGDPIQYPSGNDEGIQLQPKIIYEIDQAIAAVDNNEIAPNENGRSIGVSIDKFSQDVFQKVNLQHSKLGNSNAFFEKIYEQNEYKTFSLNKLSQELEGVDIAEASIRLQQLQLMYSAVFSSLQKVNEIEQRMSEMII